MSTESGKFPREKETFRKNPRRCALNRRDFLRCAAGGVMAGVVFPQIIPASALGRTKTPPSNRMAVALIGCGPQGRHVLSGFLAQPDVQVPAVCDVWTDHAELARKLVNDRFQNQDCRTHHDFRELLARPDIDAVIVATTDNWHVPVAIAAANAGKDLYLEKPMAPSFGECQLLRRAVRKHKRIFQFGTQQRSSREFQRAVEMVRNGRLGRLQEILVWAPASRPGGSTTPAPVPAGLDYEFWLGPAPATLYTPGKAAPLNDDGGTKTWWYNTDYSLGYISAWGIHPMDIALWGHPAMMRGPMTIEGKAILPKEGACNTSIAWDVNLTFADGVRMRFRGTPNGYTETNPLNDFSDWQARFGLKDLHGHGTLFVGSEGWVEVHRGGLRTGPEKLAEEALPANGWRSPRSNHHQRNFLDSVRRRQPAICPIEDSVQGDLLCHVADIATRLNRRLHFDPVKEKFIGDQAANDRLRLRDLRPPWRL
jgi:predicted dehydrogenase